MPRLCLFIDDGNLFYGRPGGPRHAVARLDLLIEVARFLYTNDDGAAREWFTTHVSSLQGGGCVQKGLRVLTHRQPFRAEGDLLPMHVDRRALPEVQTGTGTTPPERGGDYLIMATADGEVQGWALAIRTVAGRRIVFFDPDREPAFGHRLYNEAWEASHAPEERFRLAAEAIRALPPKERLNPVQVEAILAQLDAEACAAPLAPDMQDYLVEAYSRLSRQAEHETASCLRFVLRSMGEWPGFLRALAAHAEAMESRYHQTWTWELCDQVSRMLAETPVENRAETRAKTGPPQGADEAAKDAAPAKPQFSALQRRPKPPAPQG